LEVDAITPSIVVRARDARQRDVIGVRVLVDGMTGLTQITGKSVSVDPGPHRLRFVAAAGDAVEQDVLLAEGEHGRILTAQFDVALRPDGTRDDSGAGPVIRSQSVASPTPATDQHGAAIPTVTYVAGATALVGLSGFAYLYATAWSDFHGLDDSCGRTGSCSNKSADAVQYKIDGAFASLGVGIIALVVGTWSYLARGRSPTATSLRPVVLEPRVMRHGTDVVLTGSF
jgi:hypothetical protein